MLNGELNITIDNSSEAASSTNESSDEAGQKAIASILTGQSYLSIAPSDRASWLYGDGDVRAFMPASLPFDAETVGSLPGSSTGFRGSKTVLKGGMKKIIQQS